MSNVSNRVNVGLLLLKQFAFSYLAKSRDSLQLAGGSHAQRDVFERMTIDAGLRAGNWTQVEAILDDRRAKRGGAEDNYAIARRTLIASARNNGGAQSVPAE